MLAKNLCCTHRLNPETGQPIAVNSTFESILGPFYKFKEWEFADAAAEDFHPVDEPTTSSKKETNRSKFREAINRVRLHLSSSNPLLKIDEVNNGGNMADSAATVKIRNVEMLTLGTNDAGLPIRKYFDWTIGSMNVDEDGAGSEMPLASAVIMYGDMVNEAESSDR